METLQQTHLHILSRDHSIKLACYTGFDLKLLEINNAALKRLTVNGKLLLLVNQSAQILLRLVDLDLKELVKVI